VTGLRELVLRDARSWEDAAERFRVVLPARYNIAAD
jgi:hypothetical protein